MLFLRMWRLCACAVALVHVLLCYLVCVCVYVAHACVHMPNMQHAQP